LKLLSIEKPYMSTKSREIKQYISSFPVPVKTKLEELYEIIKAMIPDAEECISYGMPAIKKNKVIVYFGGFKGHVSLFPTSSGVKEFESELKDYKTSKGTIQFPLAQPLPVNLIRKIVKYRLQEVR
jgi:uncharacterized protein YdhG (YjbR/CyaY superfamily)